MGYDIGRAALACLLVLTVVFAASLFPATGLGGFPGGVGSSPASGPGAGPGTGTQPVDTPSTPVEDPSTPTDAGGDENSNDDETETRTETRTETSTETPEDDDDEAASPHSESPGETLAGIFGALVFAVIAIVVTGAIVAVVGSATGLLVVSTAGATGLFAIKVGGYEIDVGSGLQGISRASMGYVFALSSASGKMLSGLGDVATGASSALGAIARGGIGLAAVPAAMGRGLAGVGKGLGSLLSMPSGGGSLFGSLSMPGLGWSSEGTPDADARSFGSPESIDEDDDEYQRPPPQDVLEVWDRFVEAVPVRNPRARTPGEYARYAVGQGYPADAVGELTRTFREVRYGQAPESGDRFERARAAWDHIRNWADQEEDDS